MMLLPFGRRDAAIGGPGDVERSYIPPVLGHPISGTGTYAGPIVVPDNACRSAAVAACRRILVSGILAAPPEAFKLEAGTKRWLLNPDEPRIVRRPSALLRRRAWIGQIANSLVLHGNAYLLVTQTDSMGQALEAEPVHWSRVTWENDAGVLYPVVNQQRERLWPVGRLLVIQASPFLVPGSHLAQSPVELARESIGTGLAAEEFGARFFSDGAFPSSVIYSSQPDLTEGEALNIKARVMNAVRGTREPVVLGSAFKIEPLMVNPDDSQFIDLMRFEVEQAARFFGVPPQLIYSSISGQAVTYSNVTDGDAQFFKHSLKSWLEDIEEGWSELLPGPQRVRLNVDGFLRMDAKNRHLDQQVRLATKTATVNEIRAEEDKSPFVVLNDDGINVFDLPGIPGESAPASSMNDDPAAVDDPTPGG